MTPAKGTCEACDGAGYVYEESAIVDDAPARVICRACVDRPSRREQQVEAWLEREAESRVSQRLEAQARAEAFAECERSLGHVLAIGSNVCANCLCRVPGADDHEF